MNRRDFLFSSAGAFLASSTMAQHTSTKPKIRIGQIGTRHAHAAGKIEAIRNQPDTYEFIGVVEPDQAQRAALSTHRSYQGVAWLSEKELLDYPKLQAVAVETAVKDLVPTAFRAVEAGLHIHLDKPAGDSLPLFRDLLQEAETAQRIVQMGYMLRYNPAFQFMYSAVNDGWLGTIMEVDCMMGKLGSPKTRAEIGQFSGGGMFELGGHVIDSIVYLLGKPESVTPFTRRTQSDGVADNQLAVLGFPRATATIRINHNDPFGSPRRRFQISGTKGTLEIQQLESGRFTLYLDQPRGEYSKGRQVVQLPGLGGRYDGEFTDMAQVIRGEKKFDWSYSHDLNTQETLLLASEMSIS